MPDPRKQFLVGVRGSQSMTALETFLAEARSLAGAEPRPLRDPRFAKVQLTEAEAEAFREKYRDSLLIEPDAPLQF